MRIVSQAINKKTDNDEFTLPSPVRVARAEGDGYTVHHITAHRADGSASSRMLSIRIPSADQKSIDNVWHRLHAGTRVEIGDWACTVIEGDDEPRMSCDDIGVNCDFYYKSEKELPISDAPKSLRIVGIYKKPEHKHMIKPWWGDAQVEMAWAKLLYITTADTITANGRANYPHLNMLNVATTRAAFAFELIFKVLLIASGRKWEATHNPGTAYDLLSSPDLPFASFSHRRKMKKTRTAIEADKKEVDRVISRHGWKPSELLSLLDEICNVDRKYWMVPKPGPSSNQGANPVRFWINDRAGFDKMEDLHRDLSNLAMKWIKEGRRGVDEYWPGTDRYPDGLVRYLRDFIGNSI